MLGAGVVSAPDLPERAIQFGTGALLRGLVDAILDDANRAGKFGGRVVAVGTTGSGRDEAINKQNGLFTLRIEGLRNGEPVRESRVIASLSRALSAVDEWDAVLACARNPALEVVFSNTTEIGIALHPDDERAGLPVPTSFPAKLTRFLEARARAFDYAPDKGVVVIPCELIDRNGETLRAFALSLAARWNLGDHVTRWLGESVRFCNTLVDRIVTGSPPPGDRARLEQELGYRDELLTVCEPYHLLAIEGDDALRARVAFAQPEFGVVVAEDITPYRERKVRLLNGAHTSMVSLALLAGCETVREAVEHEQVGRCLRRVLSNEIVPSVRAAGAMEFAAEVLERFANPCLRHRLRDITLQGGMKMRVRVVPSIVEHTERVGRPPELLALGFAAYLLFVRGDSSAAPDGTKPDQAAERIRDVWRSLSAAGDATPHSFVRSICRDASMWGIDLDTLPGFTDLVMRHLAMLERDGAVGTLKAIDAQSATNRRDARERALT